MVYEDGVLSLTPTRLPGEKIEEKVDSLFSIPRLTEVEKKQWTLIQRVQAPYEDEEKKPMY